MALKIGTLAGTYKILDVAGADDRATLYLAQQENPEWTFWLVEFAQPPASRAVNAGQEIFDWKGKTYFSMPTAGTNATTPGKLVQQVSPAFMAQRFSEAALLVAEFHGRQQSYQSRVPLKLDSFAFNNRGEMVLSSLGAGVGASLAAPEVENGERPTPASDVFSVARAFQLVLGDGTGTNKQMRPSSSLKLVLERATHADPSHRPRDGALLAKALGGSGMRAAESTGSTPWLSGCVIPLLLLLLALGGGYVGFQAWQESQPVTVQATATARYRAGLALPTPSPVLGTLALENLAVEVAPDNATVQATFSLLLDGQTLATDSAVITTVYVNDQQVMNGQPQAQGGGRYLLVFNQPLEYETQFRITAAVGSANATHSLFYFRSDVTGIDYTTGGIATGGGPGSGINPNSGTGIEVNAAERPEDGELYTGTITINPVFESVGNAQPLSMQVDTNNYPRMVTYFTFTNGQGLPVRLAGNLTITAYQDGVLIPDFQIASVDVEEDPLTVALVIDVSGSMEGEPIDRAREAAIEFVGQLGENEAVCLYTFATQVALVQDCTTDKAAIIGLIGALQVVDDTALYDAVLQVTDNLREREGRRGIVILSDGADTASVATLAQALTKARESNMPFYIIGLLSEQFDGGILQQLAQETSGVYLETPSTDELRVLYLQTQSQLDTQYRLIFTSLFPDRTGGNIVVRFEESGEQVEVSRDFVVGP